MAINKKVTLTVNGYTCNLSSPLQFYKGDALHLAFSINEYDVIISNGTKVRTLTPIIPLSGFLLVETPNNTDYVESVAIVGDEIHFHLDGKYTNFIGISRMQIILTDENCCRVTLPEFSFEVKENIAENTDLKLSTAVVSDIDKHSLKTEDESLITTGKALVNGEQPITSKYIKDLEAKGLLEGIERIIIQDNQNTKQTTINSLHNYIIQHFEETIDREIKSAIGTSATELNALKTRLNNDVAEATNDLIAIEYLKRQYQEKLEK